MEFITTVRMEKNMNWTNSAKIPIASNIQSVENFRSISTENFPSIEWIAIFRRSENQQFFSAMDCHHFEKAENKMQIQLKNSSIFDDWKYQLTQVFEMKK